MEIQSLHVLTGQTLLLRSISTRYVDLDWLGRDSRVFTLLEKLEGGGGGEG